MYVYVTFVEGVGYGDGSFIAGVYWKKSDAVKCAKHHKKTNIGGFTPIVSVLKRVIRGYDDKYDYAPWEER